MNATLLKIGNLSGIAAPLVWASAIIVCGALRPEFSHITQYISELGERTSTTEFIMRYAGFVPNGLMHITFAGFFLVAFRADRLAAVSALLIAVNGIALIGAGMFPCEVGCALPRTLPSQQIHNLCGAVAFFAFIGAVILSGLLFKRYPGLRSLSAYSLVSGCLSLFFLLMMTWADESRAGAGLYERLSSGLMSLWLLMFALRLWRLGAHRAKLTTG